MRRLTTLLLGALLTVMVIGARANAADTYDVYAETSQTGQGAFVGTGQTTAIRAAEKFINRTGGIHGRPVRFIVQDDQTNPQLAVQIFNDMVSKKVPVILGPGFSAPCYAVWPLVKDQIVNYCLAPSIHPDPGSYAFSASVSTKDLALAGIRFFHMKGWKKVAVLDTTDATGQDGDNIIKENLALPEFKDMEIVDFEHFAPADVGINAQLARIKASGAQAIITWVTGTPFGTVCRGITDSAIEIPVFTNAGNVSYAQMAQYKAFLPKNMYFTALRFMGNTSAEPASVRKVQADFFAAMQDVGVPKPDTLNAVPWDAILVVVDALRHLPENPTPKQIHDYIEKVKGVPGINGFLDFTNGSQRGVDASAAIMVRFDVANTAWIPVSKPGGLPL
ncbi:MAG TPA: ABC transporter substrate-binding protein [Candidatus Binatia bacterium]|nr:ABC transporter substrate-binding protein [Candidatus Binatia bacterium]